MHTKILGEFVFGSLHNFHVIHSASRNYTWKVGHYIQEFWGKFSVSLHMIYVMSQKAADVWKKDVLQAFPDIF